MYVPTITCTKSPDREGLRSSTADVPNYLTAIYDDPRVYVDTRVHPSSLTAKEILTIDGTFNRILKPYCFTTVDLQKGIFRDDLPKCNKPTPQNLLSLVAGFNASFTGPSSEHHADIDAE
ncbi:hypothetical protein RvY_11251 [Ramazzottius varieornatus]|uniref:Uncharacterized protein n=1 Tax=Ramazzottius varieornatus TaxID=947166 RepID=A0A1D1VKY1_RAMVA|nr:hypothetical protein RvY_11251 [Ramazzottius varieornatus]